MLHAGDSTLHGVVAFDDPCRVRGDGALLERSGKSGATRLRRVKGDWTADERDVSVPQSGQMLHALQDAVMIVDLEQADARSIRPDVDEDQRHLAIGKLIEQRLFDSEGHDGYAIDFALEHAAN